MAIKRKLLIVATLAWVAPLSAHQATATARHHKSHCPLEKKSAATVQAWAPAPTPASPKKAVPTVVVVEGTPAAASALGLGRSPIFMP